MNILELRQAITSHPEYGGDEVGNILIAHGKTRTDLQRNKCPRPLMEEIAKHLGIMASGSTATKSETHTAMDGLTKTLEALKAAVEEKGRDAILEDQIRTLEGRLEEMAAQLMAAEDKMMINASEYRERMEALEKALEPVAPFKREQIKHKAAELSGSLTPAQRFLAKYLPAGSNHVGNAGLIVGGSGTGKSWAAEQHGRTFDVAPAPFACTETTEDWQLFGLVSQTEDGLRWIDGPLTYAMRQAADGKNVLFCLDEFPRLSIQLQMSFLTLLTIMEGKKDGRFAGAKVFSVRSGRAIKSEDGFYVPEVFEVPVERFCLVATGNIGEAFGVASGSIDEAVFKRFVHSRINWDRDTARIIFNGRLKSFGLSDKQNHFIADLLLSIVEESRTMKLSSDDLAYPACVRTVCRAIDNCHGEYTALMGELYALIEGTLSGWERDGATSRQSIEAAKIKLHPLIDAIQNAKDADKKK